MGWKLVWSSKLGTGDWTVVLLSSEAAWCTWACEVEKGLCCRSPAGLWGLGDSEASCSGVIPSILPFNVGNRAEAGGNRGFVQGWWKGVSSSSGRSGKAVAVFSLFAHCGEMGNKQLEAVVFP